MTRLGPWFCVPALRLVCLFEDDDAAGPSFIENCSSPHVSEDGPKIGLEKRSFRLATHTQVPRPMSPTETYVRFVRCQIRDLKDSESFRSCRTARSRFAGTIVTIATGRRSVHHAGRSAPEGPQNRTRSAGVSLGRSTRSESPRSRIVADHGRNPPAAVPRPHAERVSAHVADHDPVARLDRRQRYVAGHDVAGKAERPGDRQRSRAAPTSACRRGPARRTRAANRRDDTRAAAESRRPGESPPIGRRGDRLDILDAAHGDSAIRLNRPAEFGDQVNVRERTSSGARCSTSARYSAGVGADCVVR